MAFPVEKLQRSRLTTSDVVQCAYDLSEQDVRTYEALNNLGEARTEELAAALGKDASVAYRSLQRLVRCDLVAKTKQALPDGGYFYSYRAHPKAQVKQRLRACIDDWHAQMKAAVARL